jgi:hypothetical protein
VSLFDPFADVIALLMQNQAGRAAACVLRERDRGVNDSQEELCLARGEETGPGVARLLHEKPPSITADR